MTPLHAVLDAYRSYRAAFRTMLSHHPQEARAEFLAAHSAMISAEAAVTRAALNYATAPAPVAGSYGGAFALALHQIAHAARAEGLRTDLDRYEAAAIAAPPSPPIQPPPRHLEIRAAVAELELHLQDAASDEAQQIVDASRGVESPATLAGSANDAIEIGSTRPRTGSLSEHVRRPRWSAGVRTVGKSSIEHEIAAGDDLDQVLAVALAARETIAPGCTVDLYRRNLLTWELIDTLPAVADPDRIHSETGGELIRDGAAVLGYIEPVGTRWRARRAGAAPGQFIEPGSEWPTRAAAVAAIRNRPAQD